MDMIKDEISSIVFESEVEGEDQLGSLNKEISSISEFSEICVDASGMGLDTNDIEVKALRENLSEHVYNLQQELKFFAGINKNEGSIIRRDSINTLEILEQIISIKTSVDSMKQRLRDSQDLVLSKTQENENLKHQLYELELKNLTSNNNCVVCKSCSLF